jgi:hypothetical protein
VDQIRMRPLWLARSLFQVLTLDLFTITPLHLQAAMSRRPGNALDGRGIDPEPSGDLSHSGSVHLRTSGDPKLRK